jgi:hypothetical protein
MGGPPRADALRGERQRLLAYVEQAHVLTVNKRRPVHVSSLTRSAAALGLVAALLVSPTIAAAQEPQPTPPPETHEHVVVDGTMLTPTREGPGTAWIPAATPMYGLHRPWRTWDIRLNGTVFAQAVYEPRERHRTGGASTSQASSLNWVMLGARRRLGDGRFGVRTMLSAEPWTVPGCGSLSFLAVGEVCEGDTIHDRQQPHDLVMELAVDYEHALRRTWRWQVYAGLAGEPALGPPGYPHRASAMPNPTAPLTHHWLDATRVSFGLVTLGVHNQRWKAEVSTFNGREPDERRTDLDIGAFDSVSGRLSFLPTERLALQVSAGRLREAATDFPFPSQPPVIRTTASAMYHVPFGQAHLWATTVAVGTTRAREAVPGGILEATSVGALLESSLLVADRHTVFGRAEVGRMPAHHLHAHEYALALVPLGKLQVGYVWHPRSGRGVVPGIGASVAVSVLSSELSPYYYGRVAPSVVVFLSVRPARHVM